MKGLPGSHLRDVPWEGPSPGQGRKKTAPTAHLHLAIRLCAPSTAHPPGPGLAEGENRISPGCRATSGSPSDLTPVTLLSSASGTDISIVDTRPASPSFLGGGTLGGKPVWTQLQSWGKDAANPQQADPQTRHMGGLQQVLAATSNPSRPGVCSHHTLCSRKLPHPSLTAARRVNDKTWSVKTPLREDVTPLSLVSEGLAIITHTSSLPSLPKV